MEDNKGQAFERYVADAFRALGFQVTPNTGVAGHQTDLLARQEVIGSPPIKLAIECKNHRRPVGVDIVTTFAGIIFAQRSAGEITGGALVSKNGFTAPARRAAEKYPDLILLSQEELSSKVVNVGHRLQTLVESYEKDEIFQDYLPLKVKAMRWSTMAPASARDDFEPLLSRLIKFDGDTGISAMIVLADFGGGKTTLLRNIEYHRAKAHLENLDTRVPLFVQLRDFSDSRDIRFLLQASFRDAYLQNLPQDVLWERVESGSFYLLLDGFDEMVDRSDAHRRLELFYALAPLLRSRSPVILTSRPSYLVERGELEALLRELRAEEIAVPSPVSGGVHKKVSAERLRQKLTEQMLERGRRPGDANQLLQPEGIEVVRLQPLDQNQVKEFVGRHEERLAEVGAGVSDVLAFIDRTYDLTDLATRPMLLRLIVDTVIADGLDLSDTSTHYGASGLYEMYTRAKLDFDRKKVPSSSGGLGAEARQQIAESLALEMYRSEVLELDFHGTLERLGAEEGPLARVLGGSRLSQGEIATDLAARSFVTLDQRGICRFIHKSFRGFFIARILKERLPTIDPMFEEVLEREVLYFLGGFDPTEPQVGEALWTAYEATPMRKATLRRNLIVALLYTRPDHQDREINDVDIFEAEYGRLQLNDGGMSQVTLRDVTARRLDLVRAQWRGVRLLDTRFGHVLTEGGDIEAWLQGTILEAWECEGAKASVGAVDSTIERWDIERTIVDCSGERLRVGQMWLKRADVSCKVVEDSEFWLSKVEVTDSRLRISGDILPRSLQAIDSVISYGSERDIAGSWKLKGCVLALPKGPAERSILHGPRDTGLSLDRDSIVLAPAGISHSLLTFRAGVFGSLAAAPGRRPIRFFPDAWGVVEAEEVLDQIGLPATQPGCRLGRLLLVRKDWYLAQVERPKRKRAVVAELEALLDDPELDLSDPGTVKLFADRKKAARVQYNSLWRQDWAEFQDYVEEEMSPLL